MQQQSLRASSLRTSNYAVAEEPDRGLNLSRACGVFGSSELQAVASPPDDLGHPELTDIHVEAHGGACAQPRDCAAAGGCAVQ